MFVVSLLRGNVDVESGSTDMFVLREGDGDVSAMKSRAPSKLRTETEYGGQV